MNSTIAYNDGGTRSRPTGRGGLLAGEGTMSVENSIVALTPSTRRAQGRLRTAAAGLPHSATISRLGRTAGSRRQATTRAPTHSSPRPANRTTAATRTLSRSPRPVRQSTRFPRTLPAAAARISATWRDRKASGAISARSRFYSRLKESSSTAALATARASINTAEPITIDWGGGRHVVRRNDRWSRSPGWYRHLLRGRGIHRYGSLDRRRRSRELILPVEGRRRTAV